MAINYKNYPRDWKLRRFFVCKVRAKQCKCSDKATCNCVPKCEWCGAEAGKPHPNPRYSHTIVSLNCCHLWNTMDEIPQYNSLLDLVAGCDPCHNVWDLPYKKSKQLRNKIKKTGVLSLPF